MLIKKGDNTIDLITQGNRVISRIYKGNELVYEYDSDVNASKNILNEGLGMVSAVTEDKKEQ